MNRILRITALFAGALLALPATAHAQHDASRIDSTFSFNKDGWVDVGIISGEITITGSTRPEAKVYATIDRGWIEASLSSNRIRLNTRSDRGRIGRARVEITVPVGTRIVASGVSGSVRVTGTNGEVEASSVSGAVEVLGANDRITVSSVSGKLHVANLRGRTKLSTTSTAIEAEDIVGDISAGSVSGRITLAGVRSSHVTAGTVSGSVNYEGTIDPSGSYEFTTHSGGVHMLVPSDIGAELQLETFSGHISSAFPITLQPGDISSRRQRRMQFTIGRGGARITAQTFSGNITLDKNGHQDREER
jgi:DUF4097 and DUF4098 domain-containing protein YvlB